MIQTQPLIEIEVSKVLEILKMNGNWRLLKSLPPSSFFKQRD